ncbi:hypothetical protein J6590_093080 [Homalodisca vitripennis]|nr:hypothetical protein J6590_093080 [Homalodisca vitripennis]
MSCVVFVNEKRVPDDRSRFFESRELETRGWYGTSCTTCGLQVPLELRKCPRPPRRATRSGPRTPPCHSVRPPHQYTSHTK